MTQATDIPLIDIRPDHWEIVRDILQKHVPQYEVWAFGSRAKWTAKPYSDLDLAIIADTPLSSGEIAVLADDFSESDLPWKVDVVDWSVTTETFRQIIARDKVVVQSSEKRGEAVAGWRTATIGDFVTLQRGIDLPSNERTNGSVPIMGSFGITGYHDKAACKGPGVTVGRSGASIGTVSYIEEDYWPLNTCLYVKDFHDNNPRFCYFLLKTYDLAALNSGSAQPSLNRNFVHPLSASFPGRREQDSIVALLSTLDDKIDLNRRTKETLEAMARAVFKDWFVDFGPVRAKAEGRQPPGLSPDIAALFPDTLDDEDKPVGWVSVQLSDIADIIMGASPPGDTYNANGDGVPLVNGPVEFGDFFVTKTKWTTAPTRMSREDDLIVCVRGSTTGRHAIADGDHCLGRGVCAIRARDNLQEFVERHVVDRMTELLTKTTGSVFPNLSSDDIKAFPVVMPTQAIARAFTDLTAPLRHRIWSNVRENGTLAQLRDLLLPKLMSGEIRLKDAETAVGAVA